MGQAEDTEGWKPEAKASAPPRGRAWWSLASNSCLLAFWGSEFNL